MARLARCLRSLAPLSSSSALSMVGTRPDRCLLLSRLVDTHILAPNHVHSAAATTCVSEMRKSTFDSNIIRIIRSEIDNELDLHPLPKPVNEYNSFIVDDRPGEQWISLKRKYGDTEDITIKATMFDGVIPLSSAVDADDASGAVQLHITIFVSISKGEGSDTLEFVCSALPSRIIILRLCTRSSKMMSPQVHLGPKFSELDEKLRNSLSEYLEERGVSDELAGFLHDYMWNKDKIELIRWMRTLESFFEK